MWWHSNDNYHLFKPLEGKWINLFKGAISQNQHSCEILGKNLEMVQESV
jgi:hypothetical protein